MADPDDDIPICKSVCVCVGACMRVWGSDNTAWLFYKHVRNL